MRVPKFLLDEEKAKQFFTHSVAFSAGCILTMSLVLRDMDKTNKRIEARNEMIKKYRDEIDRIQNDVTLSGSERKEQIDTIVKFVNLILDQPIK